MPRENETINAIKFLKGKVLAVAHENKVSVYSVESSLQTRHTFQLPSCGSDSASNKIKSLSYSEKERKLYGGCFDGTVTIWDVDFAAI